ncbi:MAG TPA: Gfo/Idh/MocA family oxidoreductase [Acetobacteraceae bacterium]|jgi:predicted dehydrogenase|nr:Gfo/Idh/MocA family oxidoreductase [Acetobacteraceae bacterium]
MVSSLERRFRWGIVGTGVVARQFATQLSMTDNARLSAVASGTRSHAEAFAAAFGADVAYDTDEDLLADKSIDIVYIASPAALHHRHCMTALAARKAVLCEKPFTLNAGQAHEIAARAQDMRVFCMEAMWMRFSPLVQRTRELVKAGELGPIAYFHADIGYRAAEARLRTALPGHGALLNFGVYGVSLAHFLFGPPQSVQSAMRQHADGLDACVSTTLVYPTHLSTINASIAATTSNEATVAGASGRLRLGAPFFDPGYLQQFRSQAPSAEPQPPRRSRSLLDRVPYAGLLRGSIVTALLSRQGSVAPRPAGANGMRREAEEVMQCLAKGKTESSAMPLADSVAIMETVDRIRNCWQ